MLIQKNCVVTIAYDLFDPQGRLIESTKELGSLDYLHGYDNIVPGLEKALEGKEAGYTKTVVVPPELAYGEYSSDLIDTFPISDFDFNEDEEIAVGSEIELDLEDGETIMAVIEAVDEDQITLNANHPLASLALTFKVEVVAVREGTEEELELGQPLTGEQH